MRLRDLFSDDVRARCAGRRDRRHRPRRGQPRRQAGRSVLRAGGHENRRRAVHRSGHRLRRGCRRRRASEDRFARAVRGDAESAPRAGACRGKILSAPAGGYRGRDRHQRQDLGRRLHAADLAAARACIGQHRHHRAGVAEAHRLRLADHARSDRAASPARRNRGRGRHASGARGLVAWPRPVPARRHPRQRRRLHQSHARPHGLSSGCRALPQRKAAAVPRSGRGRWRGGDIGRS